MFRKLILVSAISAAMLPQGAAALGLGAMRSQTALNQPFVGEIDLLDARPDELDTVKARLASPDAFTSAGAERFHFLTKLRFVPQLSGQGRPVIRVTSNEPIREPYMALLVEVVWPTGKLVREYAVLLDPPATTSRQAPRVSPPPVSRPPVARPAPPPAARQPARQQQRRPAPVAPAPATATASTDGFPLRYGPVPAGAGLWRIARRIAPDGATVPQTAMALYRNNQHAFVAGDINRLLVAQRLEVPNKAELMALDPAAAESEFQAALAGKKVRRTPLTDAAIAAASEGPTQLKIAGTGAGRPADAGAAAEGIDGIEQELLLVREAGESTRQETDHLRDRIKQLESQLTDIQRLLMLRNQQLAELQSLSAQADGAADGTPAAEPADELLDLPDLPDTAAAPALAAVLGPEETGTADGAAPATDEGLDLGDTGDLIPPAGADGLGSADVDAAAETVATDDARDLPVQALASADGGKAAEMATTAAVRPSPEVIEPPSFLDSLPLPWPWLAGGLAALGLGGLLTSVTLRRRRRAEEQQAMPPKQPVTIGRAEEQEESESTRPVPAVLTEPAPPSRGALPDAETAPFPAADEDMLPDSFINNFPMDEDSDDADVLSEADIYIAYGRYREAEVLLKEELGKYPGRADLQFKLAEVYYGSGDGESLRALSDQMRRSGADRQDVEQWQHLVSMRQALESNDGDQSNVSPVSSLSMPAAPDRHAGADDIPGAMGGAMDADTGVDSELTLDLGLDLTPAADEPQGPVGAGTMPGTATIPAQSPFDSPLSPARATADDADKLLEIDELDLDMLAEQPADASRTTADAAPLDFGLPELEEIDLPTEAGEAGVLDLGPVGEPVAEQRPAADATATDSADAGISTRIRELNDDDFASELLSSQWQMDSGAWDEIGTKMELALAYLEMDDHDGARAILEEVKREGNNDQRAEAEELLAKLP